MYNLIFTLSFLVSQISHKSEHAFHKRVQDSLVFLIDSSEITVSL